MQSNKLVSALKTVLEAAQQHVDDIQSGIEDGIYVAGDNADLSNKVEAIELLQRPEVVVVDAGYQAVCVEIVNEMLATYGNHFAVGPDGTVTEADDNPEMNGGDTVDAVSAWVVRALSASRS